MAGCHRCPFAIPAQNENTQGETMEEKRKIVRLRRLRAVFERQVVRESAPAYLETRRFTSAVQVAELFRDLEMESKEHFLCLHLDGKNRIVCLDRVSVGSLNQSIVHPREVFKTAILSSAAAIILVHNHPTGDVTPSAEDREVTRRLAEVGQLVGIRVLDHVIVGDGYFSFAEGGLL
jgi:DNA repair protein RadC